MNFPHFALTQSAESAKSADYSPRDPSLRSGRQFLSSVESVDRTPGPGCEQSVRSVDGARPPITPIKEDSFRCSREVQTNLRESVDRSPGLRSVQTVRSVEETR